jgi:hypothetical protein
MISYPYISPSARSESIKGVSEAATRGFENIRPAEVKEE